jgi:hypothetical protein
MSIIQAIKESSTDEIEAAGLFWRVRRICSADLARVGFAALAMATPEQAANDQDLDATVCAGVYSVGDQDGNWDDLTCSIDKAKEDPDNGVLWVGSLPAGVTDVLFSRIMELSTDGEEAAKRLASFRSGHVDRAGGSGADVREVAP